MQCNYCKKEKGKHWVFDNTKILCPNCIDLFRLIRFSDEEIEKMKKFCQQVPKKDKSPKQEVHQVEIINNLPDKTTNF